MAGHNPAGYAGNFPPQYHRFTRSWSNQGEVFSGTPASGISLSGTAAEGGLAGWSTTIFLAEQEWEIDDILVHWASYGAENPETITGRLLIAKLEPGVRFGHADAVSLLDSGDYNFATRKATDDGVTISLSSTVGGTQGQGTAASGVTVAADVLVSDRTKLTLRRGDRLAIGWSSNLTLVDEFTITPVLRNTVGIG